MTKTDRIIDLANGKTDLNQHCHCRLSNDFQTEKINKHSASCSFFVHPVVSKCIFMTLFVDSCYDEVVPVILSQI